VATTAPAATDAVAPTTIASVSSDATTIAPNDRPASLTVDAAPPARATTIIQYDDVTADRVVQRGGGSLVMQGQTFVADGAIAGVSFAVVAADDVAVGSRLELTLYRVDDPVAAIPAAIVPFADGGERLDLALPTGLDADEPVWVTFEFPAVELVVGDTHAVVLSLAEGWSAAELYVQHAADDVDPDGVAIRFEGTRWKVDDIGGDQAVARIPG